jgi:hypothetical protein
VDDLAVARLGEVRARGDRRIEYVAVGSAAAVDLQLADAEVGHEVLDLAVAAELNEDGE